MIISCVCQHERAGSHIESCSDETLCGDKALTHSQWCVRAPTCKLVAGSNDYTISLATCYGRVLMRGDSDRDDSSTVVTGTLLQVTPCNIHRVVHHRIAITATLRTLHV